MKEKVHEQEGRTYDASRWITRATVVHTILHVLDLPPDATTGGHRASGRAAGLTVRREKQ